MKPSHLHAIMFGMAFDPQEVQALGARIRNSGCDRFGLKTDGQGNVTIPDGQHFFTQALAIDRKYFVLADENHYTHEMLFDDTAAAEMQRSGISMLFDEGSHPDFLKDLERDSQKAVKQHPKVSASKAVELSGPYSPNYSVSLQSYATLKAEHIETIACDARPPHSKKEVVADIQKHMRSNAAQAAVYRWMDVLLLEALEAKNDTEVSARCAATLRRYIGPSLLKTPQQESNTRHFSNLLDFMVTDETQKLEQARKSQGVRSTPYESAQRNLNILHRLHQLTPKQLTVNDAANFNMPNLTLDEVIMLHNMVEGFRLSPEFAAQSATLATLIKQQMVQTDSLTSLTITQQSENQKKAAIQWGAGHFDGHTPNNMRDCLGAANILVISTVATMDEMQEVLASLFIHPPKHLPDYLYMPGYRDESGNMFKAQAISVAEYIAAEEGKAGKHLHAHKEPSGKTR